MKRPWLPRSGMARFVDGGTLAVLLLWGVILFLLPSQSSREDVLKPPVPDSMIIALPLSLGALPLSLRPDLISIPSSVSFASPGIDELSWSTLPSLEPRLGPVVEQDKTNRAPDDSIFDHIRETAARAAGTYSFPDQRMLQRQMQISISPRKHDVIVSDPLAQTRLDGDVFEGLLENEERRRYEMEVWIAFDDGGRPEDVYLEKSSGDMDVDRELLRRLWNPAHWKNPSGQGRVFIRF